MSGRRAAADVRTLLITGRWPPPVPREDLMSAAMSVQLRVDDPEQRLTAVRLCSDLPLAETDFHRDHGGWVLALPPLTLSRVEYKLEVAGGDGAAEVVCDPGNPRRGDVPAIAESLRKNGMYKPLIAQASTNHILAGNHTWKAAVSLGWQEISVIYLDCDDLTAKKIVLVDNKLSDVAGYSADDLAALLTSMDDVSGTGYSADDLAKLCADLPEGFEPLDPDAAAPERDPVVCPQCGHSWMLGGLSRQPGRAVERAPYNPRRRCADMRLAVLGLRGLVARLQRRRLPGTVRRRMGQGRLHGVPGQLP